MDLSKIRVWVGMSALAFVGILGILAFTKWMANRNIPVVSGLATGTQNAWKAVA